MRVTIIPRIGRIVIARGRDAADVAISTTFGSATLTRFTVVTDEVADKASRARVRWKRWCREPVRHEMHCDSSRVLLSGGSSSSVRLRLSGFPLMLQAAVLDGVAFDPFSFHQDGLPAPEATRAYPR